MTAIEANTQAGFEDDVVTFIDVADMLKKLSWRKRFVFIARCIGYENWELAEILHKSERTIKRDFSMAKIFLLKMSLQEHNM